MSPPYFRYYLTNGAIFVKKNIGHNMCILIFSTTFTWNILLLRRIQRDIVINVKTSSCKVPVIFVGFSWTLDILHRFSKQSQISNFIKIRLVGAEMLFHADRQASRQTDGRTYLTKLIVVFRNFANAPKNGLFQGSLKVLEIKRVKYSMRDRVYLVQFSVNRPIASNVGSSGLTPVSDNWWKKWLRRSFQNSSSFLKLSL